MGRHKRKYKDKLNNNNNPAITINYPRENYQVEFHHRHKANQKNQTISFFEIAHQVDQRKIYKVHTQIVLGILTLLLQKA